MTRHDDDGAELRNSSKLKKGAIEIQIQPWSDDCEANQTQWMKLITYIDWA